MGKMRTELFILLVHRNKLYTFLWPAVCRAETLQYAEEIYDHRTLVADVPFFKERIVSDTFITEKFSIMTFPLILYSRCSFSFPDLFV